MFTRYVKSNKLNQNKKKKETEFVPNQRALQSLVL